MVINETYALYHSFPFIEIVIHAFPFFIEIDALFDFHKMLFKREKDGENNLIKSFLVFVLN